MPRFWSMNVTPHGQCWVEAEDADMAVEVLKEHYGKSVNIDWNRDDDERPISADQPPKDRSYLAEDATWRQGGGDDRPMLSRTANLLMAFGASYEEALEWQIADQAGERGGAKAVMTTIDNRNRVAARKRAVEGAVAKARQMGEQRRAAGRSTDYGLTPYDLDGILRNTTEDERAAMQSAYRGGQP